MVLSEGSSVVLEDIVALYVHVFVIGCVGFIFLWFVQFCVCEIRLRAVYSGQSAGYRNGFASHTQLRRIGRKYFLGVLKIDDE